jgi:hypothetical protein
MEFGGVVVLGVAWFLLNLLSRSRGKDSPPQRNTPPPEPPPTLTFDPTQREGKRLELLFRDFQRSLEQANEAAAATEGETIESLGLEPEVTRTEGDVTRQGRVEVDQDDLAEQVAARRISAAAARDTAASKTDRTKLDPRVHQEVADKTATRPYTARQLREAIVWQEILSLPVSLRNEPGGGR